MAMPMRLLPLTVTIVKAHKVVDRYGTQTLDWSSATRTTWRGNLQPTKGSEDDKGRTQLVTTSDLYLPPDAPLSGIDRVEIEGLTYQVIGPPQVVRRLATAHHLVATVQRVEG